MAAATWAETVRACGEPGFVIRLKEQAKHFADQFVRPGRQTEGSLLPIPLGNIDPTGRLEPIPLITHRVDDAADLPLGHAVHGFPVDPGRHRSLVGVDTA